MNQLSRCAIKRPNITQMSDPKTGETDRTTLRRPLKNSKVKLKVFLTSFNVYIEHVSCNRQEKGSLSFPISVLS